MGSRCASVFVLLFLMQCVHCYLGDPVMYLPPFEVRTVKSDRPPVFAGNHQPPRNIVPQQMQQQQQHQQQQHQQQLLHQQQQQPVLHTNAVKQQRPPPVVHEREKPVDARNFTFNEFLDAINDIEEKREREHDHSRTAEYDYQQYSPYGYRPPSYGYQQPSYGYGSSYGYQEPSGSYGPPAAYVPPATVHHGASKSLLKPDLTDIVKPVTTKVASKISGFIGLILALFTGSSPNDLELKGFKDIIINGIVKPLLIAKGGIKSLISKLTIPVISLLLINLEVLITVWWMWEDCPDNTPPSYNNPKPSYGYNSYG